MLVTSWGAPLLTKMLDRTVPDDQYFSIVVLVANPVYARRWIYFKVNGIPFSVQVKFQWDRFDFRRRHLKFKKTKFKTLSRIKDFFVIKENPKNVYGNHYYHFILPSVLGKEKTVVSEVWKAPKLDSSWEIYLFIYIRFEKV